MMLGIVASSRHHSGVVDPYWDNVVLLATFNGADNATAATDYSRSGHALTFAGNAKLTTAYSKFAGSALTLDGVGDRVQSVDSRDWDFGDEPFTIECWFNPAATQSNMALISQWSSGFAFYKDAGGLFFRSQYTALADSAKYTWTPTLNQWVFAVVERDASNVLRIYLDGVMVVKTTAYTQVMSGSPNAIMIGMVNGFSYDTNGRFGAVRITKRIARYASDAGFAVPTAAFPIGSPTPLVISGVTWNPADMAQEVYLRLGHLTSVKANTGNGSARATLSRSTGKYVFEVTNDVTGDTGNTSMGFANASHSLTNYLGSTVNSIGHHLNGQVWFNAGVAISDTDLLWSTVTNSAMAAIDLDARKVWFISLNGQWNGNNTLHDPATGLGGINIATLTGALFPAINMKTGGKLTANFGASAFIHTVPSGFSAWNTP